MDAVPWRSRPPPPFHPLSLSPHSQIYVACAFRFLDFKLYFLVLAQMRQIRGEIGAVGKADGYLTIRSSLSHSVFLQFFFFKVKMHQNQFNTNMSLHFFCISVLLCLRWVTPKSLLPYMAQERYLPFNILLQS